MGKKIYIIFSLILLINASPAQESQKRFELKRDFVTFYALWKKKFQKYSPELAYNTQTKRLRYYYENGQKAAEGFADKQGESFALYGRWLRYYETGELLASINYKDGKKQGKATGYYRNRRTALSCFYKDGKIEGDYLRRDSRGKLLDIVRYSEGKALSYDIRHVLVPSFQKPHLIPSGSYFDKNENVWVYRNKRKSIVSMYYLNGAPLAEIPLRNYGEENESKHGLSVFWSEDGQKILEGHFKDGKEEGRWEVWKNGTLTEIVTYKNGIVVNTQKISN